jgi:hypothetical protein
MIEAYFHTRGRSVGSRLLKNYATLNVFSSVSKETPAVIVPRYNFKSQLSFHV